MDSQYPHRKLGVVACACNLSPREAKTRGSVGLMCQLD